MLTINKPQIPNYLIILLDITYIEFRLKAAKNFMVHMEKCLYVILDKLRYGTDPYN
jgi:hypothetical protein